MPVIFGLDPALRSTGYAILQAEGRSLRALTYGVIKNPSTLRPSSCLANIHEKVRQLITEHRPDSAAVEGVIFMKNVRIAITLGAARGAALVALAAAGIPIYEYAPRRTKMAVTGRGEAKKEQVSFMMRALLGLTETPTSDAADALALALTHAQNSGIAHSAVEI